MVEREVAKQRLPFAGPFDGPNWPTLCYLGRELEVWKLDVLQRIGEWTAAKVLGKLLVAGSLERRMHA